MKLGFKIPSYFVVTKEMFDRTTGTSLAEFEFPAYFNFFVMKKAVTIITPWQWEDAIKKIFTETLLGPSEKHQYKKEDYKEGTPEDSMPNWKGEGEYVRATRAQNRPRPPKKPVCRGGWRRRERRSSSSCASEASAKETEAAQKDLCGGARPKKDHRVGAKTEAAQKDLCGGARPKRSSVWARNSSLPVIAYGVGAPNLLFLCARFARRYLDAARKTMKIEQLIHIVTINPAGIAKVPVWDSEKGRWRPSNVVVKLDTVEGLYTVHTHDNNNHQLVCTLKDDYKPVPLEPAEKKKPLRLEYRPLTIPQFGVTVLGASHGFDPSGTTTGFVIWVNGRGMMVDPPPGSTQVLEKLSIPSRYARKSGGRVPTTPEPNSARRHR
jgi:hypothetical protein